MWFLTVPHLVSQPAQPKCGLFLCKELSMNQVPAHAFIPNSVIEAYMANDTTGSAAKVAHILTQKANREQTSSVWATVSYLKEALLRFFKLKRGDWYVNNALSILKKAGFFSTKQKQGRQGRFGKAYKVLKLIWRGGEPLQKESAPHNGRAHATVKPQSNAFNSDSNSFNSKKPSSSSKKAAIMDELKIIAPKDAIKMEKKHTKEYIKHYYQKFLADKKANKIRRSAAGYLFKLLSNDLDNFYSLEKKSQPLQNESEKLLQEQKEQSQKREEREEGVTQRLKAEKEAKELFEALPKEEQEQILGKGKQKMPFATNQMIITNHFAGRIV